MRRFFTLLLTFLTVQVTMGQIFLTEDFSGTTWPPTGWTIDGLPNQWAKSPSNSAGGTAPEAKFTYIQQVNTSRLVSPILDLTGVQAMSLSFKYFYDFYANGPSIGVATRLGAGDWQVAWQVTPTGNQGPKTQIVDLAGLADRDFQFCFFITGNLYNVDYWFIDDVKLYIPLDLDAALASINAPKYLEAGDVFNLKGVVANEGLTPITSFDISYTVNGGAAQIHSVSGVNIAIGNNYNFTHSTPILLETIGSYEIVTTISNVNGGEDQNPANNSLTTYVSAVSFVPTKKVLAEEATGTWCQWCPRGTCFMNYMADTYPETWIGIAVHNNDPMVYAPYDAAISNIIPGFLGYPSVTTDRTSGDSDPLDLEAGYLRRIAAISPASLDIVNYSWNPETRLISFDLQSEFVADVNSELRFGVIFVEDSLWGTTSQWNQSNAYAGGGNGPMCGFESLPGSVPASQMHYDHVARMILDTPYGTPGSLPETISAGSVISYNYSYTVPQAWRYEKLHVVGFLLDYSTGEIMNANNVISHYVGISRQIEEQNISVYPNPFGDFTNVTFNLTTKDVAKIEVYDIFGKIVSTVSEQDVTAGQNTIRVNSASLPNGNYFMKLTIGNQIVTRKITISK
ncbi:MAG: hypothetical protein CVT92_10790 [Bacteroidetes bacterium HGW-Bacteroidetes-1]|jgi:hypothetical protein|nr:MAG: hypothetical protein CVT92_10790 [Bacteroidetes bacterium HGW-Bacteroidetes-1]